MKKTLLALGSVLLGPVLGCFLSTFWAEGGNTIWKPIDYFPYSVYEINLMQPFGNEFWVTTTDNSMYHIQYPCEEGQICWDKAVTIPPSNSIEGDYKINDKRCENEIPYPLLRKIKTCVSATILTPDANWKTSLALTENGDLWIWQKPWVGPDSIFLGMIFSALLGAFIGFLVGSLIIWKVR